MEIKNYYSNVIKQVEKKMGHIRLIRKKLSVPLLGTKKRFFNFVFKRRHSIFPILILVLSTEIYIFWF